MHSLCVLPNISTRVLSSSSRKTDACIAPARRVDLRGVDLINTILSANGASIESIALESQASYAARLSSRRVYERRCDAVFRHRGRVCLSIGERAVGPDIDLLTTWDRGSEAKSLSGGTVISVSKYLLLMS